MNTPSPSTISRRHFLKTASVATAATWTARSWVQVPGANSDLRVGVIGAGGRGGSHLAAFSNMKGVRLVAKCDVDPKIAANYRDPRRLLEAKDIDVISIATPNHWHALASIWAIQSGRDVYVEKPVSHNVSEGRRIVEFARKYGKIVQTGTQCRSSRTGIAEAVKWVQEGNLGKITVSRGLCYKNRGTIGKTEGPQPIPEGIDYDIWCGPAAKLPLRRARLQYDWHWVWNTGNGDLGNQGIHQMDICRWFLGETALAPKVLSFGGRLGYEDDGETPNTQVVFQSYAKAPLLFEVRGLPTKGHMGAGVGCVIHCEGGHVLVPDYVSATAYDKEGKELKKWRGSGSHFENFIKAVRSRKTSDLNADILEGHLSSALCHTGNISYRLGQKKTREELEAALKSDTALTESFGRVVEHLAANKVDLTATPATLGMALTMDPVTETFPGNVAANAMLTRAPRAPFVVPDKA